MEEPGKAIVCVQVAGDLGAFAPGVVGVGGANLAFGINQLANAAQVVHGVVVRLSVDLYALGEVTLGDGFGRLENIALLDDGRTQPEVLVVFDDRAAGFLDDADPAS